MAAPQDQDKILAGQEIAAFTSLLFEHTIEGLYASPEYGGNQNGKRGARPLDLKSLLVVTGAA